jgi:deazaflavin-dependent oxidoreductase (nitroreductase family)
MPLPRWLARFNRKATNPLAGRISGRVPGLGVLVHRGRRSGRAYRTPLAVFRRPGGCGIALTYGPEAEWVQNVLAAGGAVLERGGRLQRLTNPRLRRDPRHRPVPPLVRIPLRLLGADAFLLLDYDGVAESTMVPVAASS